MIFDILVDPYWPKCQTACSNLMAKHFETPRIHQEICNHYLMLGFGLADILWNVVWIIELQHSFRALSSDQVLPSAKNLSNVCQREYALAVDAIKNKLLWRNKLSLATDRLKLKNNLTVMAVIAYCMERDWAMGGVELTLDKVRWRFMSPVASKFCITGQRQT